MLLTYGGEVGDTDSSEISGDIASKVLAVDELQTFNGRLYWIESDREGTSIASWSPQDDNVTRHPFDVGGAAHSYGGGFFTVTALGLLVYGDISVQIERPPGGPTFLDRALADPTDGNQDHHLDPVLARGKVTDLANFD